MNTSLALSLLTQSRNSLVSLLAGLGLLGNNAGIKALKTKLETYFGAFLQDYNGFKQEASLKAAEKKFATDRLLLARQSSEIAVERLQSLLLDKKALEAHIDILNEQREAIDSGSTSQRQAIEDKAIKSQLDILNTEKELQARRQAIASREALITTYERETKEWQSRQAVANGLAAQYQTQGDKFNQESLYRGIIDYKRDRRGNFELDKRGRKIPIYGWLTDKSKIALRDEQYRLRDEQLGLALAAVQAASGLAAKIAVLQKEISVASPLIAILEKEWAGHVLRWQAQKDLLSMTGLDLTQKLETINLQIQQETEDLAILKDAAIPQQQVIVNSKSNKVSDFESSLTRVHEDSTKAEAALKAFEEKNNYILAEDVADFLNWQITNSSPDVVRLYQQVLGVGGLSVVEERVAALQSQVVSESALKGAMAIDSIAGYVKLEGQLAAEIRGLSDIWLSNLEETHGWTVKVFSLSEERSKAVDDLKVYIEGNLADPYGDYVLDKIGLEEKIALEQAQVAYRDGLAGAVDGLQEAIAVFEKRIEQSNILSGKVTHISELKRLESEYALLTPIPSKLVNVINKYNQLLATFANLPGIDSQIIAAKSRVAVYNPKVRPETGNLYFLTGNTRSYWAQDFAVTVGGNLVTVNDIYEQFWITDNFGSNFWVGLTDSDLYSREGQFRWMSGEPYVWESWQWAPGEPNDRKGEDFVVSGGRANAWNDIDYEDQRKGLVEINIKPLTDQRNGVIESIKGVNQEVYAALTDLRNYLYRSDVAGVLQGFDVSYVDNFVNHYKNILVQSGGAINEAVLNRFKNEVFAPFTAKYEQLATRASVDQAIANLRPALIARLDQDITYKISDLNSDIDLTPSNVKWLTSGITVEYLGQKYYGWITYDNLALKRQGQEWLWGDKILDFGFSFLGNTYFRQDFSWDQRGISLGFIDGNPVAALFAFNTPDGRNFGLGQELSSSINWARGFLQWDFPNSRWVENVGKIEFSDPASVQHLEWQEEDLEARLKEYISSKQLAHKNEFDNAPKFAYPRLRQPYVGNTENILRLDQTPGLDTNYIGQIPNLRLESAYLGLKTLDQTPGLESNYINQLQNLRLESAYLDLQTQEHPGKLQNYLYQYNILKALGASSTEPEDLSLFHMITPNNVGYQRYLRFDQGVNIIPGDYNGDGKTDFIRQEKGSWDDDLESSFQIYFSRGDGLFDIATPSGGVYQDWLRFDYGSNIIPGDFNGDGKTDFIRQDKDQWDDDTINSINVYFSTGGEYFDIVTPSNTHYNDYLRFDPGANLIPGDYNGDGKTDFIRQEKGFWDNDLVASFQVYFSRGDGYFDISTPQGEWYQNWLRGDAESNNGGVNIIPGDYNGDGKSDFIRQEKGSWDDDTISSFQIAFSRGDGYFDVVEPNILDYQNHLRFDTGVIIIPGDYNGDGKTDFIRQEKGSMDDDIISSFQVYYSRGDGYFDIITPNGGVYQDWLRFDYGANLISGDYNGDGYDDFIRQEKGGWDDDETNSFNIYFSVPERHSLLKSIGYGDHWKISLDTLLNRYYPEIKNATTLSNLKSQIDGGLTTAQTNYKILQSEISDKQTASAASLRQAQWYEKEAQLHWEESKKQGPTWFETRSYKQGGLLGSKTKTITITHVDHNWLIWDAYSKQAASLRQYATSLDHRVGDAIAQKDLTNSIISQWQQANAVADDAQLTYDQLLALLKQLDTQRQLLPNEQAQLDTFKALLPTLQTQLDTAHTAAEQATINTRQAQTEFDTSSQTYQTALKDVLTRKTALETKTQNLLQQIANSRAWVEQESLALDTEINETITLKTSLETKLNTILPPSQGGLGGDSADNLTKIAQISQSLNLLTHKQTILTAQKAALTQKITLLNSQKTVVETEHKLILATIESPDDDYSNLQNQLTDAQKTLIEVQKLAEQAEQSSIILSASLEDLQNFLKLQDDQYLAEINGKQKTLQTLIDAVELKENYTLKAQTKQFELNTLETQLIARLTEAKNAGSQEADLLLKVASANNFATAAEIYYRDYRDLMSDKGGGCSRGIARPDDVQKADFYYDEMLKYRALETEAQQQANAFAQIKTIAQGQIEFINQKQGIARIEFIQIQLDINNATGNITALNQKLQVAEIRVEAMQYLRNWTEQTLIQLLQVEKLNLAQAQLEAEFAKNRQEDLNDTLKAIFEKQRATINRDRAIATSKLEHLNQLQAEDALQSALNDLRIDLGLQPVEDIVNVAEYKGQLAGLLSDLDSYKQKNGLPETIKSLLDETIFVIHDALQGKEAATIQDNLIKSSNALIHEANRLQSELIKLDADQIKLTDILSQSQTDLKGAAKALYDEITKGQLLGTEIEPVSQQYLEALYRVGYAQGAIDLSSDLSRQSKSMIEQIITGRIAERNVRKRAFVNDILETYARTQEILGTALRFVGFVYPPAKFASVIALMAAGVTRSLQAAYNGDWKGAMYQFSMAALKGLTTQVPVQGGSEFVSVWDFTPDQLLTLQEFELAINSAYNAYNAYQSQDYALAFVSLVQGIADVSAMEFTGADGLLGDGLSALQKGIITIGQTSLDLFNTAYAIENRDWFNAIKSIASAAGTVESNFRGEIKDFFQSNSAELYSFLYKDNEGWLERNVGLSFDQAKRLGETADILYNAHQDGSFHSWYDAINGSLDLWERDIHFKINQYRHQEQIADVSNFLKIDPAQLEIDALGNILRVDKDNQKVVIGKYDSTDRSITRNLSGVLQVERKIQIDYEFIAKREGGSQLAGYIPLDKNGKVLDKSGLTIGIGFDIGQHSEDDLRKLGFTQALIDKFNPFLGLKGAAALKKFNDLKKIDQIPKINDEESLFIYKAKRESIMQALERDYNRASTVTKFRDLPPIAQTVIASVAFQYGNDGVVRETPNFWKFVTTQDWRMTYKELLDFNDSTSSRRKIEANYMKNLLNNPNDKRLIDPVVIDLDSDGVELLSLEDSSIFFDMDVDGYLENTAWVSSEDGILTIDINRDGQINDISEVFSEKYGSGAFKSGIEALTSLDSTKNGMITSVDDKFNQILVWQDLNQDGISQPNELKTLTQHGITSINLSGLPTESSQNGNIVRTRSLFNRTDGTIGQIADVALIGTETGYRTTKTDDGFEIIAENDSVTSLLILNDDTKQTLNLIEAKVQMAIGGSGNDTLYTTGTENIILAGGDGEDILKGGPKNDWIIGDSGADQLIGNSGNDILYIDAQDTVINGGDGQDVAIVTTVQAITLDLGLSSLEMALGNNGSDTFTNTSTVDITIDGGGGDDVIKGGSGHDELIGGEGSDRLHGNLGNDYIDGSDGNDTLDGNQGADTLNGGTGDDILNGQEGGDTLNGNSGNDELYGGDGNDILYGGEGNDSLNGGIGSVILNGNDGINALYGGEGDDIFNSIPGSVDTYFYMIGDGADLVYTYESSAKPNDVLQLGPGITAKEIRIERKDYDLIFKVGVNGDQITIGNWFNGINYQLAALRFADGSSLSNAQIGNDVLPVITLAVAPASVAEDGITNLFYTFSRTGPTSRALTVNYAISGTADATDYTGAIAGTGKTITFAAGSATATLTVDPIADTSIEPNETVALTIAAGTGYTIGSSAEVVGTISNDDLPVITLAVSPAGVTEDGTANLVYTFSRTGATTSALTVNYTVGGTATLGTDYSGIAATPVTKTVSFAANSATATVTVDPTADTTIEPDETVAVTLAAGSGYSIGTTAAVVGTILNDDFPVITLAVSPVSVTEDGTTNLVYTFTRTGPTTSALTVNYGISGSADSADYTGATPGVGKSISFAAGSATATLIIDPTADSTIEADETVALTLAAGSGYSIGTTSAVIGTISNDDFPVITLAVSPASVSEDGSSNLVYTFTRTGPSTSALTINYGISGSADSADYTGATPGAGKTISFAAGSATATLIIDPTADTSIETSETVALVLAPGSGYSIGTTTAVVGTILNDDLPVITLAVAPTAGVTEDGTATLIYTFTRSGPTTNSLTVSYGINGTADATDYIGATPGTGKTITFAAGSATATLTIDPTADLAIETGETVSLTLAAGTGYTVSTTTAVVGTINNDDFPVITLAVSPASVAEDGTANLIYTFTRSGPTTSTLTVNYGISGTADSSDYTGATPGAGKTITFAAGSATATLTIDPTVDTTIEVDETVALTLAAGTGYTVGTTTAVTGTITNDDLPVISLAVSLAGVTEDGTANLVYTFSRTGATTSALTVSYSVGGTATLGTDYSGIVPIPTTKTVSFAAGAATAIVTVDPTADNNFEADETVALTLAAGSGYRIGTTAAVTGTINNDDFPSITLAVTPATVIEDGSSNLVYTFTRTGPTTSALTVNYGISGTADSSDYIGATPGTGKTITFAAGYATATLTIDPTADLAIETSETVSLTLAAGTGYTLSTTTAVVGTINNDDFPVITLAVSPASVAEDGAANLIYTFTRSGPTTSALTVNYGISGTADSSDYTGATPGAGKTITFAAGSATATLTIDPTVDTTIEVDETVALTLAAGSGYTVGTTTAVTGTITNDDLPVISLAVSPASVTEDGTANLVYTFSRTGATTSALAVNYTVGGTASLGTDYSGIVPIPTTKTVSFAAGAATAIVTVDPTADTDIEADETVALTLAAGSGYRIGTTAAVTGTINNDDFPSITLAVTPATVIEDGSSNLVYIFTRTGPTTSALTVNYVISGSADVADYTGATPGIGKTISFAAGSANANLIIDPTADSTIEADETVALTLAAGSGYSIGTTTAVIGTIKNDDFPVITLAVSPASVIEDGTANLVYTFSRTGPTTSALTVNYNVGGTATLGTDYSGIAATPVTKTVSFAANSATATVTVDPKADTTIEPDETVVVTLAAGSGYSIGTTAAVVATILNDDLPVITLAVAPPAGATEDGSTNLVYTFSRTGHTTSALTVNYTVGGTAVLGTDYSGIAATPVTRTVSFAANSATATVTVDPTADTTIEPDETVALTLAAGSGYSIGTTAAVTGTINNDDFPSITLAVTPATVIEDGTANLIYTFTRTGPTTSALTVNYGISGTADATDYTGATPGSSKTISFAAGTASANLTIDPTPDSTLEADETVSLSLAAGIGYKIDTTAPVVGRILNDDISSLTSYTLGTGQSSLLLLGTDQINGIGNDLGNTITGNSNNNRLVGLLGADSLTGGGTADSDLFVYNSLNESILGTGSSFDVITDFNSKDRIVRPPSVVTTTRLSSANGNVTSLSAQSIAGLLNPSTFTTNSVAAFTANGRTGSFIAMNDGRAGFQADSDAIIFLQNYMLNTANFVDFL
jgi:Ca2+-binding RTX toxin-like protein